MLSEDRFGVSRSYAVSAREEVRSNTQRTRKLSSRSPSPRAMRIGEMFCLSHLCQFYTESLLAAVGLVMVFFAVRLVLRAWAALFFMFS